MNRNRYLLSFLLVIAFVPLAYIWWFPKVWRCQTIQFRGYVEVKPAIWISKSLRIGKDSSAIKTQDSLFTSTLTQAQNRVKAIWGSQLGSCPIYFMADSEQYEEFSDLGDAVGCHIRSPFGSWIVLKDWDVDVLAHEMMHDELFARLGWRKSQIEIPAWFDEGLALMVDYRFSTPHTAYRYELLRKQWMQKTHYGRYAPLLKELVSAQDFFQGDYPQHLRAYLTAGKTVAHWLQPNQSQALTQFIKRIQEGKNFEEAFGGSQKIKQPTIKPF